MDSQACFPRCAVVAVRVDRKGIPVPVASLAVVRVDRKGIPVPVASPVGQADVPSLTRKCNGGLWRCKRGLVAVKADLPTA